ncbi:MAG: tyrosine-type recombinase/integrase, partial [Enterococcus sp.]|nr:tyrosine-type recombinase/integrase [Enterococcus sp.]
TQTKGHYVNAVPLQKMVKDCARAVNVRSIVRASPHTLRHYYALKSLEIGTSIQQLSKNLGHSSIKTTEIYLSQITNEQLEKQAVSVK